MPITASFRGVELPAAVAPLRLAACDPAPGQGRAPPDAIAQAFDAHLAQTTLPFALGHPLDAPRTALVGKPWAAGVKAWYEGPDAHFLKAWGLGKYFTTPAAAAGALALLKAVERPVPGGALEKALTAEYEAKVKKVGRDGCTRVISPAASCALPTQNT